MTDHNRKLFELFVRSNEGALIAYIRTLVRDAGLVDDLFQETMLTAWRRFDEFDSSKPIGPWLRGIALNLARNAWRKRSADLLVFDEETLTLAEQTISAIDHRLGDEWSERLSLLEKCIALLPDTARELVVASYRGGESAAVLAERIGVSHSVIRKRLQRIREQLYQCIRGQMGEAY
jgi:RNA polymerase sigma-70 factor (ECF subfamily)